MPQLTPKEAEPTLKTPRTVLAAKGVDLALITYVDERGVQQTTLAVVGDNNVHLLDAKTVGLSRVTTPTGLANEWLRKGVFDKLGRKAK